MLAGNYRPIDALLEYQVAFSRTLLRNAGVSEEKTEQMVAPATALLRQAQAIRRGETGTEHHNMKSWIELDDRATALVQHLDRPVLALGGEYDWNVPPEDVRAWQATFASVPKNPGHSAVLLPCVTHVLNCISEPDPTKISLKDIGHDLYPPVADHVVAFLRMQRCSLNFCPRRHSDGELLGQAGHEPWT